MKQLYLGWDVGAWHCDTGRSRDALVLLAEDDAGLWIEGQPWRGNLRKVLNQAGSDRIIESLFWNLKAQHEDSELTIAIDTPLGWPGSFLELVQGRSVPKIPAKKAENPLLFRETEHVLWRAGYEPLSAVQDLLGSQSTKGMAFLASLGLRSRRKGLWTRRFNDGSKITAIETYPTPCRNSTRVRGLFEEFSTATCFSKVCGKGKNVASDVSDALYCAIVAYLFCRQREILLPPSRRASLREGWIWVPRDCLNDVGHDGEPRKNEH